MPAIEPVPSWTFRLSLPLWRRPQWGRIGPDNRGQRSPAKTAATVDGIRPDFYCGDEVYGSCTQLREHFEANQQAYVLRIRQPFQITLRSGKVLSCAEATKTLLKYERRWEVRSAGKV